MASRNAASGAPPIHSPKNLIGLLTPEPHLTRDPEPKRMRQLPSPWPTQLGCENQVRGEACAEVAGLQSQRKAGIVCDGLFKVFRGFQQSCRRPLTKGTARR